MNQRPESIDNEFCDRFVNNITQGDGRKSDGCEGHSFFGMRAI